MIEQSTAQTFGTRLMARRKMMHLSMDELSKASGISKPAIAKIESGDRNPKGDTIGKLAAALDVPIDYFFKNDTIDHILKMNTITLSEVSLREGKKVNESELGNIKNEIINRLVNYIEVEKIAGNLIEFINPVEDIAIRSKDDVKEAARKLRKKWKLAEAAIKDAIEVLEGKGVKVFEVLSSEDFEGFSAWAGNIPLVVINGNIEEITRIRFTALHELGHIVLQFQESLDDKTIENFCDKFASYLLFPIEVRITELGEKRTKISLQELKDIKARYGISVLAIIYGALDADIINWDICKAWKIQYDKLRAAEADFGSYKGTETPRRYTKLVYTLSSEEKITKSKAASLLEMSESRFEKEVQYLDI